VLDRNVNANAGNTHNREQIPTDVKCSGSNTDEIKYDEHPGNKDPLEHIEGNYVGGDF
jgi:hypothetical protein